MSDAMAMLGAQQKARRTRLNTQIALRQLAFGGDGKLTPNARLVLAALSRYCNGDGRNSFPRTAAGDVDQTAMVRMAGRREAFDFLVNELGLKLDDRHNLRAE